MTCRLCPFPCPPNDALPFRGGVVHAACGMDATRKAMRAGEFDGRAAVLLRRRLTEIQPSTKGVPRG